MRKEYGLEKRIKFIIKIPLIFCVSIDIFFYLSVDLPYQLKNQSQSSIFVVLFAVIGLLKQLLVIFLLIFFRNKIIYLYGYLNIEIFFHINSGYKLNFITKILNYIWVLFLLLSIQVYATPADTTPFLLSNVDQIIGQPGSIYDTGYDTIPSVYYFINYSSYYIPEDNPGDTIAFPEDTVFNLISTEGDTIHINYYKFYEAEIPMGTYGWDVRFTGEIGTQDSLQNLYQDEVDGIAFFGDGPMWIKKTFIEYGYDIADTFQTNLRFYDYGDYYAHEIEYTGKPHVYWSFEAWPEPTSWEYEGLAIDEVDYTYVPNKKQARGYPNPCNSSTNLKVINRDSSKAIIVTNMDGRQRIIESDIENGEINLDMSNWASGIYEFNWIEAGRIMTAKVSVIK